MILNHYKMSLKIDQFTFVISLGLLKRVSSRNFSNHLEKLNKYILECIKTKLAIKGKKELFTIQSSYTNLQMTFKN